MTTTTSPMVPLGGAVGTYGGTTGKNPTIVPNFDRLWIAGTNTLDKVSPSMLVAVALSGQRTDATVTATIGGSVANTNITDLILTNAILPKGAVTVTYTAVTGDTTATAMDGLVTALNTNAVLQSYGIYATTTGFGAATQMVIHWPGPVGNSTTVTANVHSSSVTVTIANSGVMASGDGPIIAASNFTWGWNGTLSVYWYGQPYFINYDQLTAMVAQGAPIV